MTDDPAFWWMPLDDEHIADVARALASTLDPITNADTGLIGIVSEEDGGIIAYAIGEDHAKLITNALLATFPKLETVR